MSQLAVASQRFYSAFYHWVCLNSHVRKSTPKRLHSTRSSRSGFRGVCDTAIFRSKTKATWSPEQVIYPRNPTSNRKRYERERLRSPSWANVEARKRKEAIVDHLWTWDPAVEYSLDGTVMVGSRVPSGNAKSVDDTPSLFLSRNPGPASQRSTFPWRYAPNSRTRQRQVLLQTTRSRPQKTPTIAHKSRSYSTNTPPSGSSKSVESVDPQKTKALVQDVKEILRALTHPVVVVTSVQQQDGKGIGLEASRGVTVSSFNTVTLEPIPYISFNLRLPSRTWDAITASQHLTVHIPDSSPEGAAVAQAFTLPYDDPADPFRRLISSGAILMNESSRPSYSTDIIKDKNVVARIRAQLRSHMCTEIGDHVIVVAEVLGVEFVERVDNGVLKGLAYANRQYRGLGNRLDPARLPAPGKHEGGSENSKVTKSDQIETRGATDESLNNSRILHQPGLPRSHPSNATLNRSNNRKNSPLFSQRRQPDRCLKRPNDPLSFSVWARPTGYFRNYSITARGKSVDPDDLTSLVSKSEILHQTVADFLCQHADRHVPPPRIKQLLEAQRNARDASHKLQRALADGSLTPEKSAELENTISRNERSVAKKLALRAANDLRRMLDKGTLDVDRTKWMEQAIEKGQAVLLDEARGLAQAVEKRSLDREKFTAMKSQIQSQFDTLKTESMRLGALMDEMDEGDRDT